MQAPPVDAHDRVVAPDQTAPAIRMAADAMHAPARDGHDRRTAVELRDVSCWYGSFRAVKQVSVEIRAQEVTALIGPSGCGKSTLLRTLNRMNDLVPSFRAEGTILLEGQDLFGKRVDPVAVRRRVGMVFQKPNPFPKSIYDNVAFGPRINGFKGNLDELVERSLAGQRCGPT
jgi:phosphate transport system ATP-binding protein